MRHQDQDGESARNPDEGGEYCGDPVARRAHRRAARTHGAESATSTPAPVAALIDDNREVRQWSLPPSGRPVAYRAVAPATVLAWHAPCCFTAATGSDNDRPPVAELPARIRRSDSPTSWGPIEAPQGRRSAEADDEFQTDTAS